MIFQCCLSYVERLFSACMACVGLLLMVFYILVFHAEMCIVLLSAVVVWRNVIVSVR
jgi:hypothetical protein